MFCDCDRHFQYTPVREMLSRRNFFERLSMGLGGLALGSLLEPAWAASSRARYDVLPKQPHFAPKAKRVILLFQNGGPNHVDPFDPKPQVMKRHGRNARRRHDHPPSLHNTG